MPPSSSSVAPSRSSVAQIELVGGEQARAELAVGGEPHPVAVAAERLGDRRDHADRAARRRGSATGRPAPRRGPAPARAGRRRRSRRRSRPGRRPGRSASAPAGVERHELDEPHLDVRARGRTPARSTISSSLTPRSTTALIFTGVEAGLLGGLDAVEHVVRARRGGSSRSNLARSSVSRLMLTRSSPASRRSCAHAAQRRAVGGHRQVDRRAATELGRRERTGEVGAHRRLAAGEADPVDPEALDEDPGEALDLLERQHLAAGQPLHALLRHAVRAAEVAAVGDRDPQVADRRGRTGRPDRRLPRLPIAGATEHAARRRRRRAGSPSPSGTIASALASAVAASWWLPWAPTERDVAAAVVPERRVTRT